MGAMDLATGKIGLQLQMTMECVISASPNSGQTPLTREQ